MNFKTNFINENFVTLSAFHTHSTDEAYNQCVYLNYPQNGSNVRKLWHIGLSLVCILTWHKITLLCECFVTAWPFIRNAIKDNMYDLLELK